MINLDVHHARLARRVPANQAQQARAKGLLDELYVESRLSDLRLPLGIPQSQVSQADCDLERAMKR